MIHMHCFKLCFTKSRGFAGVRLWLGDYHYPSSRAAREGLFSETQRLLEVCGGGFASLEEILQRFAMDPPALTDFYAP